MVQRKTNSFITVGEVVAVLSALLVFVWFYSSTMDRAVSTSHNITVEEKNAMVVDKKVEYLYSPHTATIYSIILKTQKGDRVKIECQENNWQKIRKGWLLNVTYTKYPSLAYSDLNRWVKLNVS
ncbi:hypothetical protein PP175_28045 (plasmid) [Aneurinibacillus sp. Ricciae_BoGa-3]|uniref:hypothetical protein n=1 Tax=Aneurinibacillus sp. Ricciae_BoGa-3 TaxID=3022697 RepID=UPI00234258FA|nr:hypothetical protein [Aneurinibacillus sp. Ricciae_BoGa-3]WCK57044.1 hypothetical protein PP175_28045 [Aneurinibacillus sp. Ricciae_BoGa-3]